MKREIMVLLAMGACGQPPAGTAVPATTTTATTAQVVAPQSARVYLTADQIPACGPSDPGALIYIQSSSGFFYCDAATTTWTAINVTGPAGAAGASIQGPAGANGTNGTNGVTPSSVFNTVADLPTCSSTALAYVIAAKSFYYCDSSAWAEIQMPQGATGPQGPAGGTSTLTTCSLTVTGAQLVAAGLESISIQQQMPADVTIKYQSDLIDNTQVLVTVNFTRPLQAVEESATQFFASENDVTPISFMDEYSAQTWELSIANGELSATALTSTFTGTCN